MIDKNTVGTWYAYWMIEHNDLHLHNIFYGEEKFPLKDSFKVLVLYHNGGYYGINLEKGLGFKDYKIELTKIDFKDIRKISLVPDNELSDIEKAILKAVKQDSKEITIKLPLIFNESQNI